MTQDAGRARVLRDVRERFADGEVGGGLDRDRQPRGRQRELELDRHRRAIGQSGQGVAEAAVAQDRGVQPVGKVTQVGEARSQVAEHLGELGPRVLAELRLRPQPDLQPQRDGHEPLLRAVVEVAFDLAPGAIGGVQDPCA